MVEKLSKLFREFLLAGIDWVMASGVKSQGTNSWTETLSGAAPHSLTFEGASRPNMADASYQVLVDGETAGRVTVDESSKTATGFDVLGGVAAEVVHVVVIGRLEGMPAE